MCSLWSNLLCRWHTGRPKAANRCHPTGVEGLDVAVKAILRPGAVSVEGRWTEITRAVDVLNSARASGLEFTLRMSVGVPAPNQTDIDILLEIGERSIYYECKTTANALFGNTGTQKALVDKLKKQLTKDPNAEIRFLFADTGTTDEQADLARGLLEVDYAKVPPNLVKKIFKHDSVTGKLILDGEENAKCLPAQSKAWDQALSRLR